MRTVIRAKNAALLAKIETEEGIDAEPLPGVDAVLTEGRLQVKYDTATEQTNENTGTLDSAAPIPGGTKVRVTFDCFVKGSGVAGVPPEFGKLLKACSLAEIITANPVPAVAEAVAAGTATTAQLGAGAAATAQLYRGMPLAITGAPANATGIFPIADYGADKTALLAAAAGAAIAGTNSWQVLPSVVYRPASDDAPSVTLYVYRDKKLTKVVGARGTLSIKLASGKAGRITFEFTGMFAGEVDAAVPAGLVFDTTRPPSWRDGRALIQHKIAAMASLQVTYGNKLTNPDNPNTKEGFDPGIITGRGITATCDPLEELVATRDTVAMLRGGDPQIVLGQYGAVAGNRVALTIPAAQVTGKDSSDREDLAVDQLSLACTGYDAGAFLAFF